MTQSVLSFILVSVLSTVIGIIFIGIVIFFLFKFLFRTVVQRLFGLVANRLLEDKYHENLMELWSAVKRTSILNILEISLRSDQGKLIKRPIGSSKHFPHFDGLMFIPAQLARLPKEGSVPVDMSVKLGPKVEKPLDVKIPLLIGGMAYGIGLSEEARRALARGAKLAGTAICSGEGPFLQEERDEADKYIWQISRSTWGRNPQAISAADMVEVQMGHGARIGAYIEEPVDIKGKAQKLMGISPVEKAKVNAVLHGITDPWDWPKYVSDLRQEVAGKPIGIKIMAGGRIEADLAVAIEAGFDVIMIGGAQGGTSGAEPIFLDDFGMPSINALVRTERYLREQGVRHEVSLVVSGGYCTPGECLKALALGADAIYLGTVPLFALVHKQIGKVLPWEPLTGLVYYNSKYKNRLDINLASQCVANVLQSMVMEMEGGIRALGKTSLRELGKNDLVALDDWTAELVGVPRA